MGYRDKISAQKFYDCISDNYEEQLKNGILANTIRKHFQRKLLSNFRFGNKVLDIGCGTGIDAVFLASNKIYVTATDISPKMIEKARQKIRDTEFCDFINISIKDSNVTENLTDETYDGVISNFDSINHLDIPLFINNLNRLLRTKGKVQLTALNKRCLWEFIYYMMKFRPLKAIELFKSREKNLVSELNLFTPGKLLRYLSSNFRVIKITCFGFIIPPDGFRGLQKRFGKIFRKMEKADMFIASFVPFRNFCDHYIIEIEKIQ